jgi:Zn-finger nucleic acid-binding protein
MEQVKTADVTVDRCTACKGLWLDAGEFERLRDVKDSQLIDTGDLDTGRKMDRVTDALCPRCNVALTTRADVDQDHVHFDACPSCKGMFLDAGEFTDLKSYNLVDYLKGLIRRPKKKT